MWGLPYVLGTAKKKEKRISVRGHMYLHSTFLFLSSDILSNCFTIALPFCASFLRGFHESVDNIKFWPADSFKKRLVAKESGQGLFQDAVDGPVLHDEMSFVGGTNLRNLCCSLVMKVV